MAIVTGPLHSDTASGTFAKAMTFRTSARGSTCRRHAASKKPPSPPQLSHRAIVGQIAYVWKKLGTTTKAVWDLALPNDGYSLYARYLNHNLRRWYAGHAPQQVSTPTALEVMPGSTLSILLADNAIRVTDTTNPPIPSDHTWFHMVFRDTTPDITPNHRNLIAARESIDYNDVFAFLDAPTLPATYYYIARQIDHRGNWGVPSNVVSINWNP